MWTAYRTASPGLIGVTSRSLGPIGRNPTGGRARDDPAQVGGRAIVWPMIDRLPPQIRRPAGRLRRRMPRVQPEPKAPRIGGVRIPFRVHSSIRQVPDPELREAPRNGLNRVCDISDWREGRMLHYLAQIREPVRIHRKAWEFGKLLADFEKLGSSSRTRSGSRWAPAPRGHSSFSPATSTR